MGVKITRYKNIARDTTKKNFVTMKIKRLILPFIHSWGNCAVYAEKNHKIFAKRNVKRVFISSCENLDYGVKKFYKKNDRNLIPLLPLEIQK